MSTSTLNLTPTVYEYLKEHSVRETSMLSSLRAETAKLEMSVMQISPEQGQFMAFLIEAKG